ncbi:uncharacterized protein LOC142234652 isoform X2 [Haematobia irritans]
MESPKGSNKRQSPVGRTRIPSRVSLLRSIFSPSNHYRPRSPRVVRSNQPIKISSPNIKRHQCNSPKCHQYNGKGQYITKASIKLSQNNFNGPRTCDEDGLVSEVCGGKSELKANSPSGGGFKIGRSLFKLSCKSPRRFGTKAHDNGTYSHDYEKLIKNNNSPRGRRMTKAYQYPRKKEAEAKAFNDGEDKKDCQGKDGKDSNSPTKRSGGNKSSSLLRFTRYSHRNPRIIVTNTSPQKISTDGEDNAGHIVVVENDLNSLELEVEVKKNHETSEESVKIAANQPKETPTIMSDVSTEADAKAFNDGDDKKDSKDSLFSHRNPCEESVEITANQPEETPTIMSDVSAETLNNAVSLECCKPPNAGHIVVLTSDPNSPEYVGVSSEVNDTNTINKDALIMAIEFPNVLRMIVNQPNTHEKVTDLVEQSFDKTTTEGDYQRDFENGILSPQDNPILIDHTEIMTNGKGKPHHDEIIFPKEKGSDDKYMKIGINKTISNEYKNLIPITNNQEINEMNGVLEKNKNNKKTEIETGLNFSQSSILHNNPTKKEKVLKSIGPQISVYEEDFKKVTNDTLAIDDSYKTLALNHMKSENMMGDQENRKVLKLKTKHKDNNSYILILIRFLQVVFLFISYIFSTQYCQGPIRRGKKTTVDNKSKVIAGKLDSTESVLEPLELRFDENLWSSLF